VRIWPQLRNSRKGVFRWPTSTTVIVVDR